MTIPLHSELRRLSYQLRNSSAAADPAVTATAARLVELSEYIERRRAVLVTPMSVTPRKRGCPYVTGDLVEIEEGGVGA